MFALLVMMGPADSLSAEALTLEPCSTIRFAEDSIGRIALAPDGAELFVQLPTHAINLWAVPIMYWPELGGLVVGLALLWCAGRIRRVVRSPQRLGEPYCRRCGYCLSGCPSERCPECGRPARRVQAGRTRLRRSLPAGAVALALAAGYGAAWGLRLPRGGWLSHHFEWHSESLERFVSRSGWQAHFPVRRAVVRIVAVELSGGGARRTVALGRFDTAEFETTPDGNGLLVRKFVPYRNAPNLRPALFHFILLDARTGQDVRRLQSVEIDPMLVATRQSSCVGFSTSGRQAYLQDFDSVAGSAGVIAWDLVGGATTRILRRPAPSYVFFDPRTTVHISQMFDLVPAPPLRFVEIALPREGEPRTVRVLRAGTETRVDAEFSVGAEVDPFDAWPVGERVYLDDGGNALAFDLTGRPIAEPDLGQPGRPAAAQGDWLVRMHYPPDARRYLSVRPVDGPGRRRRLMLPEATRQLKEARLSRDGRWLAATIELEEPDGMRPDAIVVFRLESDEP